MIVRERKEHTDEKSEEDDKFGASFSAQFNGSHRSHRWPSSNVLNIFLETCGIIEIFVVHCLYVNGGMMKFEYSKCLDASLMT